MGSRVIFYFTIIALILAHEVVSPVKGQCTVEGCESWSFWNNAIAEIQQMFAEAIRQQQKDQFQSVQELLVTALQQKNDCNQPDDAVTSLPEIDRRSREQDIYIKQVHALLNATNQQMKTQFDTVLRSLEAIDRRLNEHDVFMKNQTQNSWRIAVGLLPNVQLEIGIDLAEGPALLPTVNNWIILMNRFNGSLDFHRTWREYKNGFGDIGRGEFWLGNEKVHRLTNRVGITYTLRIEVQLYTSGNWFYADYATFSLDSEANKYALRVSGYSGNAGDSLTNTSVRSNWYQGGMCFTTWDADNDKSPSSNCAQLYQAGWWHNSCWFSCLTCRNGVKFAWESLTHLQSGGLLRAARMMIKSK